MTHADLIPSRFIPYCYPGVFTPSGQRIELFVQPMLHVQLPFHTYTRGVSTSRLHLTALCNDNVLCRLAFWVGYRPRVLNFSNHFHALDDIAEYNVLTVQVGCTAL